MKKRKRAIDGDVLKELAILGHMYQVLSYVQDEKPLFLKQLEYKLANIINNYSRYWDLSERYFQKRWRGIDEKSRNASYYPFAYVVHLVMLYKYDYSNKKIGKGLMAGMSESDFLDLLSDMEKSVGSENIDKSVQFAEKVYSKLTLKGQLPPRKRGGLEV